MSAGTFFKTFSSSDRTTTRTLLHEAIPITGTLAGMGNPYVASAQSDGITRNQNIKTYSHAMFQSVYDYPFLSSSANHLFDITAGFNSSSLSHFNTQDAADSNLSHKKNNIYNQMAQVLSGYDVSGSVRPFDIDGDLSSNLNKIENAIFINFSRLLVKDEIKKGSFSMQLGLDANFADGDHDDGTNKTVITDTGAETSYKVNSPAGEYGLLYGTNNSSGPVGLIYYQAGVVVLNAGSASTDVYSPFSRNTIGWSSDASSGDLDDIFSLGTINAIADGFRRRIHNISFNNTTELNSTIYFCRASHNEFNYSSNPTYLSGSSVRVKNNNVLAPPRSYVTTVGLYSADNELLATAKLSEPIRKDPSNELTLRVRLDY
tara:strand:- start:2452 stop:3573 length:1122 start_codon:yes stop_codon:yes gene_type:complete